jgi:YD repeat-containing protein
MTYDLRSRLLARIPDPSLGEPNESYTYYDVGARHTMTDASGTTTYFYDDRDRVLTKATPAGTLSYTYDPAGNVATVRSSNPDGTSRPNGTSVDYAWDAANQLVSVTDNNVGATTPRFTATGQPNIVTYPNGVQATYSYDNLNRVMSLAWQHGTSPVASASYTYNDRGQRLTAAAANARTATYAYDDAGRLTSETITGDPGGAGKNGLITYALDPVGNRLTLLC